MTWDPSLEAKKIPLGETEGNDSMKTTSDAQVPIDVVKFNNLKDLPPPETISNKDRISRRRLFGLGAGAAVSARFISASGFAPAAAASTTTVAQSNSLASQSGTVTLRFMRFAGLGWEHDTKFVDEFMEANPNIVVEPEDVIYAEMFNKCLAAGATDNLADVFSGHNIWAPYLAFKGLSLQLDDAVEAGSFTDFDDWFPSVIEDARGIGTDGRLYWIPTVVHPGGNAIIIFNMDILNSKGVTPPESKEWTVAEYEEIIRASADPDNNILGTDINVVHPLYTQQYARTWGTDPEIGSEDAWLLSRDGKTHQLESPPVKEALEWYQGLVKDRLAPTSGEKAALEGSGVDHFSAGLLASRAGTVGAVANLRQTVGDRFKMQAVLWPKGPHGHRGSCLSYNTQSVWSKSENPDEAIQLVDYITGPEPAFWVGYEGALHAMARRSAWFNPELWERFPVMEDAASWFDSGIDPFPQPSNLRFVEWQDAWKQETTAYFDGEEDWDQMVSHTQSACQAIIDLPRP